MSSLLRTTRIPLGTPVAGDLDTTNGRAVVPIDLGYGEALLIDTPSWGRDLITATTAAVDALDAELGYLPARRETLADIAEERDVYAAILHRITTAENDNDRLLALEEGRLALEYWRGQRPAPVLAVVADEDPTVERSVPLAAGEA
jgi:hypothetical protein